MGKIPAGHKGQLQKAMWSYVEPESEGNAPRCTNPAGSACSQESGAGGHGLQCRQIGLNWQFEAAAQ
jgi:hypothetical protein